MKTVGAVLFVLVLSAPSPAWPFEFSGERIFKEQGKETVSSVKAKEDRWRFEYSQPQAGAMAAIVRLDRRQAWLILSKHRAYLEVQIAPEHLLLVNEKMEGEVSRELLGTEHLNGYPTELFEVKAVFRGVQQQFYQWVTEDQRFAMKTVSKSGDWSLEYRKVIFTDQSDLYFETPRGYVLSNEPAAPSQGRVEVVLAGEHRQDLAAINRAFAEAGLPNVHVQFTRQGQPPPNIGIGRDIPVERAQAAIRLAKKYNRGVRILLPEHLFPATFITIASSNFDDTVDYPIDEGALRQLEDPTLTSEQFHSLYRSLTPLDKAPAKKGRSF